MSFKKLAFYLGVISLIISGCTLNDAGERGEICPPWNVKGSGEYKYISLPSMNCYLNTIELPGELFEENGEYPGCDNESNEHGRRVCRDDIKEMTKHFPAIKQEYEHCLHYRKHGVLDADKNVKLGVEFYWNAGDNAPGGSLRGDDLGARSCLADYPVCTYHEDYNSTIREDGIPGAYGCKESCNLPKLYCGDGADRKCINPMTSNEFCGAKGSCSGDERGVACAVEGNQCIDGQCSDCLTGESLCGDGECVDLMRSVNHCGSCGNACANGEICVNGECAKDECPELDHVCSHANVACSESQNAPEACGKSCTDCTKLPNVAEAECSPNGACHILRCKENYYIYRDDASGIEQCRMTTDEKCASPDGTQSDLRNCLTQFEHGEGECVSGECRVKDCELGYAVSDDRLLCVEPGCEGCNSITERCFKGRCLCKAGYTNCGLAGCVDVITDSEHCGKCHHSCKDELNVSSMAGYVDHKCQQTVCTITQCEPRYHIANNRCALNNDYNCGEQGRGCYTDGVEKAHCDVNTGKCVIENCEPKYHLWENGHNGPECEKDDSNHCGSHEATCHGLGAVDVKCLWDENDKPYCVTESCKAGYHLYENSCELDDETNCGEHGIICPKNTKCVSENGQYICKCNHVDFSLCSGACVDVKTDALNCGGCGNECTNINEVCSNHKCVCPATMPTLCDQECVDTQSTVAHCGGCNKTCSIPNAKEMACENGSCKLISCKDNCKLIGDSCKECDANIPILVTYDTNLYSDYDMNSVIMTATGYESLVVHCKKIVNGRDVFKVSYIKGHDATNGWLNEGKGNTKNTVNNVWAYPDYLQVYAPVVNTYNSGPPYNWILATGCTAFNGSVKGAVVVSASCGGNLNAGNCTYLVYCDGAVGGWPGKSHFGTFTSWLINNSNIPEC